MLARMDSLCLLDLHIDRSHQRVSRDGVELAVSGLSWRLLQCLLEHGTDVVAFDTLAAEVWAPAIVGEDAISQRVKLLRQALGDSGRSPRYIRSVRGRGYQLCAAPVHVSAVTDRSGGMVRTRRPRQGALLAAGALVLCGVAACLLVLPGRSERSPATPLLQRADHYAAIGQASNNERAIGLYRQALQADPDSAAARRGLARVLAADTCLFNGSPAHAQEALLLAGQVLKAMPRDAAALSARGYAYDCLGAMAQAISDYQQALQYAADDERTRASLAYLRQEKGELAQALQDNLGLRAPERVRFRDVQVARELELLGFADAAARRHERVFQLYPDNVFANIAWPRALFVMGQRGRAQQALDEALRRGTPHPQLFQLQGELRLAEGDRPGAVAAFKRSQQLRPQRSMGATLAGLYGSAAASPEWVAARLADLDQQGADGWSDGAIERALLLQASGDAQAALAALHDAVDAGFRDGGWLRATPLFAPLHSTAGWQPLLARIEADVGAQRARVLAASWRPDDLRGLDAAPAAGTR